METALLVGAWLFAVTHVDTLVVIAAFCADNEYQTWEVLIGHCAGFAFGLVAAVVGAVVAADLLQEWTFLLGVVPLGLGLWGLLSAPPETTVERSPAVPDAAGRVGVVTVAAVGLSGENIAVFVPFFAELSPGVLAAVLAAYAVGAGIVFLLAFLVVSRFATDGIPERLDRWLVPTVLVVLGGYVVVTGLV